MTWPERKQGYRSRWPAALGLVALLAACPEPEFSYGRPCSSDDDCPDGYRCAQVLDGPSSGVCVTEAIDAGRTDASADASVDASAGLDRAVADLTSADQQTPVDSALPTDAVAADTTLADAAPADASSPDGAVVVDAGGSDAATSALQRLDRTRALYPSYGALLQAALRLEGRVVAGGQTTLEAGSLTLHGRLSVVAP